MHLGRDPVAGLLTAAQGKLQRFRLINALPLLKIRFTKSKSINRRIRHEKNFV